MSYVALGTGFFGGLLWVVGLWVRPASLFLAVNFVAAILLVHLDDPYTKSFEAIQMLTVSLFLLLYGAGRPSLDRWRANRGGGRSRERIQGQSATSRAGLTL